MIIILCFLTGELRELEVPESISRVYNVKSMINDFLLNENENNKKKNDNDYIISMYEYKNVENIEMDDYDSVKDGQTYRVFISTLECYVVYMRDGNAYVRKKSDRKNINDRCLSREEISQLTENKATQYYFDMKTFQESWFDGSQFFESYGYSFDLEEDSENEYDDYEENCWDDPVVFSYTKEYLEHIFNKIQKIVDIALIHEQEQREKNRKKCEF